MERLALGLSKPTPGGFYQVLDPDALESFSSAVAVDAKPKREERKAPGPMRFMRIYWAIGGRAVDDPPAGGWQTALVFGNPDGKRVLVFCPYTLRSFDLKEHYG